MLHVLEVVYSFHNMLKYFTLIYRAHIQSVELKVIYYAKVFS